MSHKSKGHANLEARLGHKFADPELLDRALTHSSAIAPARRISQSYQRLEFLGDRVLGLVVADML
jgi:ribonuclease-3